MIRRGFADLPGRQVHFRQGGAGRTPLLMLHGAPGSSRQLEPLMQALAASRAVLAPDMPGNGDSPALPHPAPDIAAYAAATLDFLDAQGLGQVDVYGSHTGGTIAVELAILAPSRVGRLIIDGLGYFSPQEQADYLAAYAPPMAPDLTGAYLQTAFSFLRDQMLFWPWFARQAENRRASGLPPPAALHAVLVELLKALDTYHLGYRAAFAYPTADSLKLLAHRTLVLIQDGDPLTPHSQEAAPLIRDAKLLHVPRGGAAAAITDFLDAGTDIAP